MIEKLKFHSKDEIKKNLAKTCFGELIAESMYIADQPPTDVEMMNKINEIIDLLNKLVEIDHIRKEDNEVKRD